MDFVEKLDVKGKNLETGKKNNWRQGKNYSNLLLTNTSQSIKAI